jgi:hypothetical protein
MTDPMDLEEVAFGREAQAVVAQPQAELVLLALELLDIAFAAEQLQMKRFQQVNGGSPVKRPGRVGPDRMLGHLPAWQIVRLQAELCQNLFVRNAPVLLEPLLRRL